MARISFLDSVVFFGLVTTTCLVDDDGADGADGAGADDDGMDFFSFIAVAVGVLVVCYG